MRQRQRMHGLELLQRGADAQGPIDPGSRHGRTDIRQARSQFGEGQMAVGIDKHGFLARQACRRRRSQMVWVGRSEAR